MKTVYFFIYIICGPLLFPNLTFAQKKLTAQKPQIDTSVLEKWPELGEPAISTSGKYISYYVAGQPTGSVTLVITNSNGSWKREYTGAIRCYFSGDERQGVFYKNDSLHFLSLGGSEERVISTKIFQYPSAGKGEWLAYQETTSGQLVLFNLLKRAKKELGNISDFMFDKNGSALLLKDTSGGTRKLYYLELETMTKKLIWNGKPSEEANNFQFDETGERLVFMVGKKQGDGQMRSIWCYRKGRETAELKLRDGDTRIGVGLQIGINNGFSGDGRWIIFKLQEKRGIKQKPPGGAMVDVWGYRDRQLQPEQMIRNKDLKTYKTMLAAEGDGFRQLERGDEQLVELGGDMAVVGRSDTLGQILPQGDVSNPSAYYLLSLKDGSRKLLGAGAMSLSCFSFSPGGRWLVYYDDGKRNFFSYDVQKGRVRNITGGLPTRFTTDLPTETFHPAVSGVQGWLRGDSGLLLHDNYDLWEIDPEGRRPAVNVTGGYGLAHHIKLRMPETGSVVYSRGDTLILTGFKPANKQNGFFRQVVGSRGRSDLLTMGPYTYYRIPSQNAFNAGMPPLKAARANCWIVERQSATEAPNYFLTSDFKSFKSLSHLAPQAAYNWLTTELINYKQLDGTATQGVLYKPENFDPKKRYPVIFNYYEQRSHQMYEFLRPGFTRANINIPWFVSRGYLVFTPDIHYKLASTSGISVNRYAYNSIIAAAHTLSLLPYVDGKRMSIQGQSFGAEETNYLVTHSHLFAAASDMAGISDVVSAYLTLVPIGGDVLNENSDRQQFIRESSQGRMQATLWQRPELYLEQSAVLHADHVTTPLLIVNNKKDASVQWRQGVEFYLALRRLQKPSWMLQYDRSVHVLTNDKDAKDYTIRLTQFFDHYLKGYPPPIWMTKGVPAKMKGIETGYELDLRGSCSSDCPICKKKDYSDYFDTKANPSILPVKTDITGYKK